jgi:hypothetical protein
MKCDQVQTDGIDETKNRARYERGKGRIERGREFLKGRKKGGREMGERAISE